MARNVSDQHGRAFEYAITLVLSERDGATLTSRAQEDQARDRVRFDQLPQELATHFMSGARCVANHIHILVPPGTHTDRMEIDRLPDVAGRATNERNVSDICLKFPNHVHLNLSIKNNHLALKHQRPSSLMQQLGYPKGSPEDIAYRNGLQGIYGNFYREARDLSPDARKFCDLTVIQPNFIDEVLYAPVCGHVCQTLTRELQTLQKCQQFFSFLIGKADFSKIVLRRKQVEVTRFSAIQSPTQCTVSQPDNSHISLDFNNGWLIALRLHTAASAMGKTTPSLKFDTQGIEVPLPTVIWNLRI